MGIRHFMGLFALLGVAGLSTSCTRTPDVKAGITIQIPSNMQGKAGALSVPNGTKFLSHVIINVTGPGMPQKFYAWDSNNGTKTQPATFDVTVPAGLNRLVQALVLYKTAGISGEEFYYGDAIVGVQNDTDVNVVVASLGSVVSDSRIVGRWVDNSDNYGPTTKIIMKYTPPGKPTMTVHSSEMFGGLFSLFALQGANGVFDYVTPEGLSLFNGPAGIDTITGFGANLAKVAIPAHYRQRNEGGVNTYEQAPASYAIVGWFGPNAAGHDVCYPSSVGPMRGAYTDSAGTSPLAWSAGFVTNGGSSGSLDGDNLCTSTGTRFTNYLSLDGYGISGYDDTLGVRGPYLAKYNSGWRNSLQVTYSNPTLTLDWEYAANVVTKAAYATRRGVDGSDVYLRILDVTSTGDDRDYKDEGTDGVDCSILVGKGFTLLTSKAATEATPAESVPISTLPVGFATAYSSGRVQILLCPYQMVGTIKKYFNSVAEFRSYAPPATQILVVLPGQTFSDGATGVSGSPSNQTYSVTFPVTAYAVYYSSPFYYIATNYNSSGSISSGGGIPGTVPPSGSFVNGVMNFSATSPATTSSFNISISGTINGTSSYVNTP